MTESPRIAICPGSYDPVTNGHLDIIGRVSRTFENVVVGVVNKPMRKNATLFTAEERVAFIEDAIAADGLENVEVRIFSNLLVEFAREVGATAVVKGLRAISDFEYEFEMAQLNHKLDPEIESFYVFAAQNKGLSVHFATGEHPEDMEAALNAIADGKIDIRPWLSKSIGLNAVAEAVTTMSGPSAPIRSLVDPRKL